MIIYIGYFVCLKGQQVYVGKNGQAITDCKLLNMQYTAKYEKPTVDFTLVWMFHW